MLKLRKTRGFESRPVTSSATKNLSAVPSKKIKNSGKSYSVTHIHFRKRSFDDARLEKDVLVDEPATKQK